MVTDEMGCAGVAGAVVGVEGDALRVEGEDYVGSCVRRGGLGDGGLG